MLSFIFDFAEALLIYILIALIVKYVFLEKGMEAQKQTIFHCLVVFILFGASFLDVGLQFSASLAYYLSMLAGDIYLVLSKKEHKFLGILLIFPIIGFVDGLMLPIISIPAKLLNASDAATQYYRLGIYILLYIILILFYFTGADWREKFDAEIADRKLKKWELSMLCFVGILLMFFSALIDMPLSELGIEMNSNLRYLILLLGLSCFAMTIAVIVVILVGNKQNFFHDKVTDMQFNIIIMMAEIVESRDENTGGHIRRTAKYVEIIAKQLKKSGRFPEELSDHYIKDMMVAAPLHDIGKIHVSDTILNKPKQLDDAEFAIMKTHAAAGRDLLNHAKEHLGDFHYLDIATQMAGFHHEWWDGSAKGYPDHIKGEEIPLCARIMAVADVFDALISKRCYKPAMPLEKAYAIIREESGTHFDPQVVDAFFEAADEIEAALEIFEHEGTHNCMASIGDGYNHADDHHHAHGGDTH